MAEPKSVTRRYTRAADQGPAEKPSAPAEKPVEAPKTQTRGECTLPGCDEAPEWRGLCPAHRQTHRGLAEPKERSGD